MSNVLFKTRNHFLKEHNNPLLSDEESELSAGS